MHFGRKHGTQTNCRNIIGENELLSITPEDYVWASLNERGEDFETAYR